jgi:hypothetical protein
MTCATGVAIKARAVAELEAVHDGPGRTRHPNGHAFDLVLFDSHRAVRGRVAMTLLWPTLTVRDVETSLAISNIHGVVHRGADRQRQPTCFRVARSGRGVHSRRIRRPAGTPSP